MTSWISASCHIPQVLSAPEFSDFRILLGIADLASTVYSFEDRTIFVPTSTAIAAALDAVNALGGSVDSATAEVCL